MIDDILQNAQKRMEKSLDALRTELSRLRTGRAHPSLLEHIKVNAYGTSTPLNQVANVNVEDARTLSITPWDKANIQAIEKAIMTSDLGLNPVTAGTVIRIPMPPLTEERRKSLVKVVRDEGEKARVAIRNIRREANNDFKDLLKEKAISEDDERRAQAQMQKQTDDFVKQIDQIIAEKEKDVMTV